MKPAGRRAGVGERQSMVGLHNWSNGGNANRQRAALAAQKILKAIQTIYLGWGGKAGPDRLTWGGDHTLFGVGD
jgi:hypothetical protein